VAIIVTEENRRGKNGTGANRSNWQIGREANMAAGGTLGSSVHRTLQTFFFERELPYGMALLRIVLPWTVLIDVLQRWVHVREIYSADGAAAQLADNFGFPNFLPELPAPAAIALYTALTFLLVTSSLGWCTRFSLVVSTILYMYFGLMDCLGTITKYTVIASHFLMLLSVSPCGKIWSVDSWLARRGNAGPPGDELRCPIWAQRLGQLLLGAIYFGAAVTKMHTPAFFSGEQLMYWTMTYANSDHPLGDLLSQYPLILSVMGYVTITWEVVFLFTVFQRWLKWWVLAVGAIFHIMTAFTLGLFVFPVIMMATYLCFLSEQDVRTIFTWPRLRRWRNLLIDLPAADSTVATALPAAPLPAWRPKLAATSAFAGALLLVCAGAIPLEHWIDPYQMRGPNGPLALRELSPEEVERLFCDEIPLRQSDKMLAFDLGTTIVGEHLFDHRREFRQRERFYAQVTFSPPHEDMWVDCLLMHATTEEGVDGKPETVPGAIITKVGQIVAREDSRSNFVFNLDESCAPGEYFLKLRAGNEEIARRKFTLLPGTPAPAAN
jgi:hypothetical protein